KRNLNGLWAERYGGNFGLVEELMDSSRRNARWTRQLYALEAFVLAGLLGWFFQSSIIDMLNWAVFIQPYKSGHVRPYVLGRDAERAVKPGDSFQECKDCPEMIVIPSGEFWMGSPDGEGESSEHPRHKVKIDRPFAVGKFEVTWDDWKLCVWMRACND